MTNEIHKRMKQWLRYNECAIIKLQRVTYPEAQNGQSIE